MQKLPIGIQDFRSLREGGYVYVDKTEAIHRLITSSKYYFLARPRRFGKSLIVNTLAEIFKGSKELFEGLWIENQWDWSQTFPVVQIGFSSMGYQSLGLVRAICRRLQEEASKYGITLESEGHENQFRELILKLSASHGKVAILIDEYDKPIIDHLENPEAANTQRDILKTFYSVLKDADAHIRLVFITGVSKFSRVSIFSELNNLQDLTVHPRYTTLFGYTQEELETYFAEELVFWSEKHGGGEKLRELIREWYNGYSWDGENRVYNPFSILNFFSGGQFQNFWFTTGTPTFLVKMLKSRGQYNMDDLELDLAALESFDLEKLSSETLLFQTGYITIKEDLGLGLYKLGYPNREVRESMLVHLATGYRDVSQGTGATPILRMAHAILKDHTEELEGHINALLASIPYEWHQSNEAYYHTIMHLAFSLIGVHIQSEIHTARGRLDSVIQTDKAIYVVEFKADKSAEEALIQIEEKGYAQPFVKQGKRVIAIGINFSSEKKAVDGFEVREL